MRWFHAMIHAAPAHRLSHASAALEDEAFRALTITSQDLPARLNCSFEAAQERLERLPRLFFEPDGSFVWCGEQGWAQWQLDGNLYDHAGRLTFVELKGRCGNDRLDDFLSCLGWPAAPIVFQLPRFAVYLDEAEFRRYACS